MLIMTDHIDLTCDGCGETHRWAVDDSAWKVADDELFAAFESAEATIPKKLRPPLAVVLDRICPQLEDLVSVRQGHHPANGAPDFILFLEPSPLFPKYLAALRSAATNGLVDVKLADDPGLLSDHSNVSNVGCLATPTMETTGDGVESSPVITAGRDA
jgi:hypothetical protein